MKITTKTMAEATPVGRDPGYSTHRYGHGIEVDVCNNCSQYRVRNDPDLVFLALNHKDLPSDGIAEIKHSKDDVAPFHSDLLGDKQFLFLAPLQVSGIGRQEVDIYFGFDHNRLRETYSGLSFIDTRIWSEMGWHLDVQEHDADYYKKKLFRDGYRTDLPTDVLLETLDLRLSSMLVGKSKAALSGARRVVGKELREVLIQDTQKLWDDMDRPLGGEEPCECDLYLF